MYFPLSIPNTGFESTLVSRQRQVGCVVGTSRAMSMTRNTFHRPIVPLPSVKHTILWRAVFQVHNCLQMTKGTTVLRLVCYWCTAACGLWTMAYLYAYGTEQGREWYRDVSDSVRCTSVPNDKYPHFL